MKSGRSIFKKAFGRLRRFFISGARSRMIWVSCAGVAVARSVERASLALGEETTSSAISGRRLTSSAIDWSNCGDGVA